MTRFDYFKITFVFVSIALSVGLFVYGLFGVLFFDDTVTIKTLLFKSLFVGFFTGLLLGLLNMYFKVTPFAVKNKK